MDKRNSTALPLDGECAANTDTPKKSRWWVDFVPPLRFHIAVWSRLWRRSPVVWCEVYRHGHELFGGREREIKVLLIGWGRRFTDRSGDYKAFDLRGRWS